MGWATDGGEDLGGQMADYHAMLEAVEHTQIIKDDRKRRVKDLSGKYVIVTKGRSSGNNVFFQD